MMKATLVLLAVGLSTVLGYPTNEVRSEEGWVMVPNQDGHFRLISLDDLDFEYSLALRKPVLVKFKLYTKANPINGDDMVPNDANWLANSNFNPNNPTRVITHGWMGDGESRVITLNRDSYLSRGNYNVIGCDWSQGGGTINYIAARANVNEAANQIATYLKFLNQHGMSYDNTYLIGHSLGAHVVGMTGKYLGSLINTIFGLDPAMPLFNGKDTSDRLAVGDAKYVQTIQTNVGILGFDIPIGDAAFYPNWGGDQPGCGLDLAGTCAHYRSWGFMAESVANDQFWSIKCSDYDSIKKKYCPYTGSAALMGGEPSNPSIRGVYYLKTNKNEPYAEGKFFM